MPDTTLPPTIAVTVGGQARVYHAFITTATPALDGPSTMTLHTATLSDVCGFAADPIVHDATTGKQPARLVLIEERELAWTRANYKALRCLCAPASPVLISPTTLEAWLWLRLQAASAGQAHA
jgi:hypothetical protein